MIWKSLTLFFLVKLCAATSPRANTKFGPIEGRTITLFNGKKVDAYLGVPYAAPPTGKNRFAAPRPPAPWNEPLKTQAVSKSCFQSLSREIKETSWYLYEGPESEDCLYLNIWKPFDNGKVGLPVMVWIHGGSFLGGSASMALFDGGILCAENDIVIVTLNYRLAMLGFLYLNSSEVPGNAGIQDQIMAIKWVRENIRNFGGDPERVTLFGESVGATSIGLHLVNPTISGLFQYAILESGSLFQDGVTTTEAYALKTSHEVAENAGCLRNDTEKMLECLRSKPVEAVVKSCFGFPLDFRLHLLPVRNGEEVPRVPGSAVQTVRTSKRQNIMSTNIPMEASTNAQSLFPGKNFTEAFTVDEREFRILLENAFHLSDKRIQNIAMHEYRNFKSSYNRSQLRIEALDMVSDNQFICPCIDFIKSWATKENEVYYLYFQHRPSRPIKTPVPKWVGATHGDEIPFVFGTPMDPKNGYTTAEAKLSKQIMKYWTNFAKHGDPNGSGETYWPSVELNRSLTYLVIEENETAPETFLKERMCNFWSDIYPQLLSIQEHLQRAV